MATQNVNIGVNVSDNGTAKKVVKSFQEIEAAARSAQKVTEKLQAGTPGSRAVAATMAPKGLSGQEYGNARGTAGATGASARDFANQAQGLGGLVRVYATFAANLFAVSAAFNALKNAADTTSMVRGLEQLGAQGGRNLGALSLRVAELSDGAVSLREAMTATAQATAAGMSSRNLERLTTVAKTASQALGINMPDALSRLSRGVTKLEPELLDELGIFVKVDEAVTTYARSIGKTATGLTDFERRHAFAIAAIEQGEKKFGSIQLDANPYNKLLASVTNLSQKILETVNTAVGPLIELLSQSPKALGLAIAGIAAILLKQAIPALGMYRENARMMAEETRQRVLKSVQDQQAAASQMDTIAAMRAEKAFQTEKSTQEKIAKLQKGRFSQELLGKDLRSSLKKSAFDITPEETSALKARSQALLDSDNETQKKQGAKLQAHLSKMEALRMESSARGDAAAAQSEARDAKWYSHQQQMAKNLEKLNRDAAKRAMLSGVADTAAVLGPVAAFKQLSAETKKLDAGPAAKTFAALQGSLTIAGSAAVTALNAFSGWIALFGMIAGVVSTVIGFLSETKKESAATAQAFDGVSSSVDNVTRTLEALAKKTPLEQISVDAIQARATAFGELAENIALANTRAVAELAKMGKTDKFVDWVSKLWGGDVQSKLNQVTAEGFVSAFTAMERGPVSDKLRESFKNLLGVDSVDATSLEAALEKLPEDIKKIRLATLTKDLKEAGLAAQVTAAKGKELTDTYAESAKQLQDLRNSFLPTDAVSKLGMTIINAAGKLDLALKDPVQTLNAMNAAVKDSNSLSLFPAETANMLIGLKGQLEGLTNSYAGASKELEDTETKIASLIKERSNLEKEAGIWGKERDQINEINAQLKTLADTKQIKTKLLYEVQAETQTLGKQFDTVLKDQFGYGAKLIADKLSAEWVKAGNTIGTAIAGMLGETESGIKMRAKYETAALDAQREQIKTQLLLIESNERLSIAIEQDSLDRKTAAIGPNADARDLRPLADQQIALDRRRGVLGSKITKGSTATQAQRIKEGELGARESLTYVQAAEAAFVAMENISAQMSVVAIQTAVKTAGLAMKTEQDKLDREAERLKLSKDGLSNIESIVGTESALLQVQKQANDQAQLAYDNDKKSYELRLQLKSFEILQAAATSKADKASIGADIEKIDLKIKELAQSGKIAKTNLDNKQIIEKSTLGYSLQVKEQEKLYTRLQEVQTLESDRLGMLDSQLENYKQLGAIGEEEYTRAKLLLDNDKARLETQTRIDQIRKGANDITAGAEQVINQSQEALKTATPENQAILNEKIREQRQLIDEANKSGDAQVQSLLTQLGLRTQINTVMAQQAITMEKVNSATQALASLFGELGTKIGNTVAELVKYSMGSDAMGKRHAESLKGMDKDSAAYTEKSAENAKEREKFEITSEMNAAKVAKGLFKEKTAAFKILNNLEKIRAAQAIALSIKEAAIKLGLITQVQIASFAASAKELAMKANTALVSIGIDIPKIYAATIGQLGIFGPPVAAAMIAAFVGSAFGGGGGSTFVPNSEQRQETQGTAMGYDANGNKVQVRRGVFGDTDAKSESIANSLEILRETSVDGLSYDNQMVKLLESIDRGINKTAKSLYSIEGLRSGSMFGTVPGTQSGGGFLGTGVFASKTTRTISDSGILIEGTFADLAKDTNKAVIDFFEQVTVSKKSWYGKTKTWVETTRKEIDDATSGFFKEIFGNATLLLKEAGSKANIGADAIDTILGGMQLKDYFISLRGLKGEDFQKELSSIISSILDDASSAIFESFEKYAKFGEGMLETVNRVIDNNMKIDQALRNLGSSFDVTKSYQTVAETIIIPGLAGAITIVKMIGDTAFDISEALVENAGSLESFLSQAEFFRENFLTAAQQLAPITTAVNVELVRLSGLGFAAADGLVDTREEFRLLVQNLDLSTEAGRNAYQSLMNVQEGFIEMIDAAEQAAQQLKDSREDLFNQVLALTGTSAQILAASRAKQLSETAKELVPLQTYVYALEDVKAAEQALTKAREAELGKVKQQKSAIESTISSLKNYIDSFKKFKDSLLLGAASPLTPTEKYAEAKKQFDAILATATGVAATPEQERAKNAALGQLESSATAFLDASKTYNASSSQYIDDFNLVQRALTDSTSSLAEQLTTEEKSLAALDTQITLLEEQIAATNTLNNSILSIADAIRQLDTAKTNLSNATTAGLDTASTTKNDVYRSSLGGFIIGNQLYGSKGNTGIVSGANGSTENTLKYMRMVEKGEATAKELRRIYVDDWGIDSGGMARITGMSQSDVLAWFKRQDPTLPAFASGTNFVPEDMIAQIHQGERIIPAADNAELMSNMGNRDRANEVLVSEIKKLNQKIDSLEKAVAQGAVINAEATNRNTVEISRTVKDTGSTTSHNEAIRRRTQVV